ncbi:carboxypeptidase-like protein A [Dendryphion nanum]|uniref:Carboxypeptidase M14A n=1 Tax=Dendryphion nanum TaxID=256645 RepID=A0A9P9D3L1_9PLEO|nr:carboxypeptidase-like protein A [Dendryphion nanum]
MKLLSISIASLGLASAISLNTRSNDYEGTTVWRVTVGSNGAKLLQIIKDLSLQTWKGHAETSPVVDVMVAPSVLDKFKESTKTWDAVLMHKNLGESIKAEGDFPIYPGTSVASFDEGDVSIQAVPDASWFNAYHSIADHTQWLNDLAAAFPDNAETFSVGKSLEGRDILGIHIWGSGGKASKPGIVWHSTVHAREWVTTMVNEYAAYQLLTATDAKTKAYKDKYDFYILPIVNPDGFAFSQTGDRMWRKNRQKTTSASCLGRDINRNWPHSSWSQRGGASTSPCAQDYKGEASGDGVETKLLKAHLDSVSAAKGLQLYMDIHSYSQLFMYPYGYTCSGTVPLAATYQRLTAGAIAAIKAVHGTTFTGGPICNTIYQVSGDSVDYALENAKAKFSMTVELRDTGNFGFILPAAQIKPSGEEMWAGLAYLLDNM